MKYLIFISLLFIGCEKSTEYECKECAFIEDNQQFIIFVCGEELKKYEQDLKCYKIDSKNGRAKEETTGIKETKGTGSSACL